MRRWIIGAALATLLLAFWFSSSSAHHAPGHCRPGKPDCTPPPDPPPATPPNIAGVSDPTAAEGADAIFRVWFTATSVESTFLPSLEFVSASAADVGSLTYSFDGQATWLSPSSSGTISIPAGRAEFHIRVPLLTDSVAESSEQFNLRVMPVTNGGTVTGFAIATITNVAPPPPPVEEGYPASYFTGPLGNRNPLPPKGEVFLIEKAGSIGCDWPCIQQRIISHENAIGRPFDAINNQFRPADRPEPWIHSKGALPIIDWNPGGTLSDVLSGSRNAQIDQLATYVKQYPFIIMLRFFHEFDLAGWSHHGCGQTFIDAWRYVINRIQNVHGVTNLGYWWSPTEGGNRSCISSSYPGDTFVDWAGSGWYNWCYVGETTCFSTPLHSGWATFSEIFDYNISGLPNQHDQWGPRKPIVFGETMTVYDPNAPAKKPEWFQGVVPALKNMPHSTGVMFFDSDVSSAEGPKANFLVDHPTSNTAVGQAFVTMARDPIWHSQGS